MHFLYVSSKQSCSGSCLQRGRLPRSLSPACTPLKTTYDSCFNLWFEGYLQPALDNAPSTSNSTIAAAPAQVQPTTSRVATSPQKARLITSWSSAFTRKAHPTHTIPPRSGETEPTNAVNSSTPQAAIDNTGKTRAQIKAEEYDRACGEVWKEYQSCLKVSTPPGTS
jgi:hypothetical protein